jgi:OmpA-OmpF porin, OOP family
MYKTYKRLALSGFAAFALSAAMAAHADVQPGFYAGLGAGTASVEDDDTGFDGDDTAFKLFGGYAFNDNFAVELAYIDGGTPDDRFGNIDVDLEVTGLNASAVGRLPVSDTVALFGKVGFASYDLKATARLGGASASDKDSDTDLSYGVGGSVSFAERFEVRVEWEAIDVEDGSFSLLSVNGLYRF